ncbi:RAD51-associated protein 2 isoform X2 [Rhinoderma darwinii]
MYRRQQSNTEVDGIWHEKMKYRGTLQSQQSQLPTQEDSLVGITAENEVYSLKSTHFPHLVMHLSMEDMILSQTDLIWENYIIPAYNSDYSDDLRPFSDITIINNCTFIPRENSNVTQKAIGPHTLYERSIECSKTSVDVVGFSSTCHGIFTAQKQRQVKDIIWNSYGHGDVKIKNLCCKRKLGAQLDGAEKRTKRSLNRNKSSDLPCYCINLNEKTNVDFIPYAKIETKDQDRFVKPCQKIEASSEINKFMPMLRNAQETCCNVRPGSKICDDECYFGSVLKSLVITSSSLGVTAEVFSSTFIAQTDSSVDYTKGHCKVPAESDECLCLTSNTDNNINLHVLLSAHPCILTSNVILSDVNCSEPGERQGQNCLEWVASKRRRIQDEMVIAANTLTSSPNWNMGQKNKLSLPSIDKKNLHFGNNDESFLLRGKTFSIQRNYPRKLEKQHVNFSIIAASLQGTLGNEFSAFHSNGLQSTSQTETSHEMTDKSFPLEHEGIKYEQAEVEVSLGTENINNSTGRAHLDYKAALNKQDFCFPSHFQNEVDTESSKKETSGKNVDFYMKSACSKQVSYTECFQKICLENCLMESESSNSKETSCSFRDEILLYKSRSTHYNSTTMEYKPSEYKSKCQNIKQQYKQERNEELLSGNIHHNIVDSSVCEKILEDVEEVDMTFNHLDGMDEESVKLYVVDELLNSSPVSSVFVETAVHGKSKQGCDPIKGIKTETYVADTKENTDDSSVGSNVLLKTTDFEMKAQFDLVLEELKMFHMIEEEKVEHLKREQGNSQEHTCSNTEELQDIINEKFPRNIEIVGGESEVIVTKKENICDRKITTVVREQEVPQQNMSPYPLNGESLHSVDIVENIPKALSWTPAFPESSHRELSITSHTEKAVTFSHGIGRVTPLKTRTGPLRIGLSKKAKIKQLHPYLQ